ncbi:MAG: hypothetical protein ACO2PL_08750 [Armatimonadota bacterium]
MRSGKSLTHNSQSATLNPVGRLQPAFDFAAVHLRWVVKSVATRYSPFATRCRSRFGRSLALP